MRVFDNADTDYVCWLEAHPAGYVFNAYRKPHRDYLILHRTACKHVSRTAEPPVRWTTSGYIKVCADTTSEIEGWCRDHAGSAPHPCGHCRPYGGS